MMVMNFMFIDIKCVVYDVLYLQRRPEPLPQVILCHWLDPVDKSFYHQILLIDNKHINIFKHSK